jgi:hypothetical protein
MTKLNKIKKQWTQPHFIVLVGNRQERVLAVCKSSGGGPGVLAASCIQVVITCNPCSDLASS